MLRKQANTSQTQCTHPLTTITSNVIALVSLMVMCVTYGDMNNVVSILVLPQTSVLSYTEAWPGDPLIMHLPQRQLTVSCVPCFSRTSLVQDKIVSGSIQTWVENGRWHNKREPCSYWLDCCFGWRYCLAHSNQSRPRKHGQSCISTHLSRLY